MKKGLIITLPTFDTVTEYFSSYSKDIIKFAIQKNIPIKQIKQIDVTRQNTQKVINKLNHKLIVFNGHGTKTQIFGHKNEILIDEKNFKLLKERIVYSRACEAAHTLGKKISKEGGCFIGYKEPFGFYANTERYHNPIMDERAGLFLNPSNLVPISLLKGNTVKEATQKSKKQMLKNIKKILRENSSSSIAIAQTLYSNYCTQIICGNEMEKL